MTSRTIKIVITVLLLAFAGGIFFLPAMGRKSDAPPVLSAAALHRSFSLTVSTVGELDAARSTVLVSQVRGDRGKIIFILDDGARVERGDVVVRLDSTQFEEEIDRLAGAAAEVEALISAHEQALKWEKIQGEREIKTAEFDLRAAELDLQKLEKGDGPLELMRLETESREAEGKSLEKAGYLKDLADLLEQGYINETEMKQAETSAAEAKKLSGAAALRYESYRDFVLPALLEKSRARIARAEMQLEQAGKSAGLKVGRAMAELEKVRRQGESAEKSLAAAKKELERTVIRAPIPGIVVLSEEFREGHKRKPRVGDVVWQNQPLVFLPDISKMVVRTRIREVDLYKVSPGEHARIYLEAYPDLHLSGKVRSIGILAESSGNSRGRDQYFQVHLSVEESDPRLRPGMTARVEIECALLEEALSVPAQSVFNEDGGSFCFVASDGGFEMRPVQVGVRTESWAEILTGLAAGERVALSRPPAFRTFGEGRPVFPGDEPP